nr:Endopeptidase La [Ipomoea batatas]
MGLFQPYRCRGRLFPNGRGRGRAGGSHDFLIALMVNELSAHRHLGYSSSNLISGSGLNTLVKMKELQLGVFQKSKSGFQAVARPIEMFLSEQHSDSDVLARCAVAVVLDGSRAFVIEIQLFVKDHLLFLLMDSTQHLLSLLMEFVKCWCSV